MNNKEKYSFVKNADRDKLQELLGKYTKGTVSASENKLLTALAGTVLGAGAGGLIGHHGEQGALRGAGIGATTGLLGAAGFASGGDLGGQLGANYGLNSAGLNKLDLLKLKVEALKGNPTPALAALGEIAPSVLTGHHVGSGIGAAIGAPTGYFAGKAMFGKKKDDEDEES